MWFSRIIPEEFIGKNPSERFRPLSGQSVILRKETVTMSRSYHILIEKRTAPVLYGGTFRKEEAFLSALLEARLEAFRREKTVPADTVCPVCGNRTVYASYEKSESGTIRVVADCEACGEIFLIDLLEDDVFHHRDRESAEGIETPFGAFHVKVNGIVTPFSFMKNARHTWHSTPLSEFDEYTVQIDMTHLTPGDEVFCGFDEEILEFSDSDEHTELLTAEDDKTVLGLCGFEPVYPWEEFNSCCYDLIRFGDRGFTYKVLSDPEERDTDGELMKDRILTVSMAWIGKREGCDPALELFLTLA